MHFFSFISSLFFLTVWFFRQIFWNNGGSFWSVRRWSVSLEALMHQKPFSLAPKNLLLQVFQEKSENGFWGEPPKNLVKKKEDIFSFKRRYFLHFFRFIHFFWLANRIKSGVPSALILGFAPFLAHNFLVRRGVFLPRTETEEMTQNIVRAHRAKKGLQILELGCGSGVIGVSLFSCLDVNQMFVADINAKAICLTRRNFQRLVPCFASLTKKHRLRFFRGNVFCLAFREWLKDARFDIIVSNPPYVGEKERDMMDWQTKRFDPPSALYAGADGLDFYQKVFPWLPLWLKRGGVFYGEMGFRQSRALISLADQVFGQSRAQNQEKKSHLAWSVDIKKDFLGKKRFLTIKIG